MNKKIIAGIVAVVIAAGGIGGYAIFHKTPDISSTVTGGDTVFVSNDDIKVTKDDLYKYFMTTQSSTLTYGAQQILNDSIDYICDKEITDQKTIDKKVKETLKEIEDSYGETSKEIADDAGYDSVEEYKKDVVIPEAKARLLEAKYIDENYDALVKELKVHYLKTITFNSEADAQEVIDKSTSEKKFDKYLDKYSGTDNGLVTSEDTTLDDAVLDLFDKFTSDGVYKEAIKTDDDTYIVVYVYNSDLSEKEDEVKDSLTEVSDMEQRYQAYYLKKYNFKVNDKSIKEEIEDYFGDQKVFD